MKSKVHIVANVDSSIKTASSVYDVTLFHNFLEWSKTVEENPTIIQLMIVTEDIMPFTASNMDALFRAIDSSFFTIHDKIIYCIKSEEKRTTVADYLVTKGRQSKIQTVKNTGDFQGILSILNGTGRTANENELHTITYRVRADEYAKAQTAKKYTSSDDEHFMMDDEELPEDTDFTYTEPDIPEAYSQMRVLPLAGETRVRSYFGIVLAQFLSLYSKTVIFETDLEYHTVTDSLATTGALYTYVDYEEFVTNAKKTINKIKASQDRLILIGCSKRHPTLTYDFIMMLCLSQLKGFVEYMITGCDLASLSPGSNGFIVMENTIPDILTSVGKIPSGIDCSSYQYVVVSTKLNNALSRPAEMVKDILTTTLEENIEVECYDLRGLSLTEGGYNDLQVLFTRDSGRQVGELYTFAQS